MSVSFVSPLICCPARLEEIELADLLVVEPEAQFQPWGKRPQVAVVDPFSTGAVVASYLNASGADVHAVYSAHLDQLERVQSLVPAGLQLTFSSITAFSDNIDEMIRTITLSAPITAVVAGAETGVELADALSERMGLRSNGTASTSVRRNKFLMGEAVRASGLRAVKQLKSSAWGEVESWIAEWNPSPFRVIVKPIDSAGSDDITLCNSLHEVRQSFGNILGKVNGLGLVNDAVLVQEYLEGE